ncbi:MAG: hypothetical protein IJB67_05405 [Firmicutes bacterium]|nr:hypothetical protein [Bacillota bacterium]
MCTNKELKDFLVKQNDGKCLATKADIMRLTGLGRNKVVELTRELPPVGGPSTYFLGDVAEALRRLA